MTSKKLNLFCSSYFASQQTGWLKSIQTTEYEDIMFVSLQDQERERVKLGVLCSMWPRKRGMFASKKEKYKAECRRKDVVCMRERE